MGLGDQDRLLREAMFVVGSHLADAFAAEQRTVMDDFDDARAFLGNYTSTVAPVTLRLQFRETAWKARGHGFGNEGTPLHLRHGAGRRCLSHIQPRNSAVRTGIDPVVVRERYGERTDAQRQSKNATREDVRHRIHVAAQSLRRDRTRMNELAACQILEFLRS